MEGVFGARKHNGMPRIRSAGKPYDNPRIPREVIDNLAFSLSPRWGDRYLRTVAGGNQIDLAKADGSLAVHPLAGVFREPGALGFSQRNFANPGFCANFVAR